MRAVNTKRLRRDNKGRLIPKPFTRSYYIYILMISDFSAKEVAVYLDYKIEFVQQMWWRINNWKRAQFLNNRCRKNLKLKKV